MHLSQCVLQASLGRSTATPPRQTGLVKSSYENHSSREVKLRRLKIDYNPQDDLLRILWAFWRETIPPKPAFETDQLGVSTWRSSKPETPDHIGLHRRVLEPGNFIKQQLAILARTFSIDKANHVLHVLKVIGESLEHFLEVYLFMRLRRRLANGQRVLPSSDVDFEWTESELSAHSPPPDQPTATWTVMECRDNLKERFLDGFICDIESRLRIMYRDPKLVIFTQVDYDFLAHKIRSVSESELFKTIKQLWNHLQLIRGSLYTGEGHFGLRSALAVGDPEWLYQTLLASFTDYGIANESSTNYLQILIARGDIDSQVLDEPITQSWKKVLTGFREGHALSKREISLFTCTMGPATQGWWTKYIDLAGDLGDTDILHLEWLHLSDNVKRLEKAHEIYVDMSYKVATHAKNTICRNLAKQGAFDKAEKVAVTANRKYFGPVDEITSALLSRKSLEHSRFDLPGGPPLVWRNFQQQVAEFEGSIGVRWEPDGVTGRHVFEEEWGEFHHIPEIQRARTS